MNNRRIVRHLARAICGECEQPFSQDEWEVRCWRDGDGADVHRDTCCVRCRLEPPRKKTLAQIAGELGLSSVTWNEPA